MDHWKEDWFFGYQCLNGSNPRMIKRCTKLPENFPVTSDMVQSSMPAKTSLDKELRVGNRLFPELILIHSTAIQVLFSLSLGFYRLNFFRRGISTS